MKGQARLLALVVTVAIASCTGDSNEPASTEHIVILGAPIDGQVAVGGGFALYPEVHDAMGNGVNCKPFSWTNSNPAALEMAEPTDVGSVLVMARDEGRALLTVRCDHLKASVSVRVIAANSRIGAPGGSIISTVAGDGVSVLTSPVPASFRVLEDLPDVERHGADWHVPPYHTGKGDQAKTPPSALATTVITSSIAPSRTMRRGVRPLKTGKGSCSQA
jgi:hypothetical protein